MVVQVLRRACLLAALSLAATPLAGVPARGEDMAVYQVELKDGVITPDRLEVKANAPFKLELHNAGSRPAEFECRELNREKILTAGARSVLVFRKLSPGEYVFFDEFTPDGGKMLLISK